MPLRDRFWGILAALAGILAALPTPKGTGDLAHAGETPTTWPGVCSLGDFKEAPRGRPRGPAGSVVERLIVD